MKGKNTLSTIQEEPEAVRTMKELLSANDLQLKFTRRYPVWTYA